jgi:CheY-like chemotaxis protein
MNKQGPIVIIEDDEDDQLLLNEVFKELAYPNEIIYFEDGEEALNYLSTSYTEPFLIISDISMPRLSGLELREKIHNNEDLRLKCIPHVLFSTTDEQKRIVDAYSKSIQGFFIKPNTNDHLKETIRKIVEYWNECVSPNYVK